ncbi:uncharacterized protein LAJ45_01134 [Morchella importuna]|uniref:uncharacterized protein n=1 Tax=Morchella importuna TaxID=1174673 RepID=UPI001E8DD96E|nr:uncharacterized protein LAJ45_01134 [Morchella importuna]KAH8154606.1 hypothetical protein LAJ45_01134 [Morchella importuna]
MAKKMTKVEHALWRKNRTQELIQSSRDLRPEFQSFLNLTIHDKFPYKRILGAWENVKEIIEDHGILIERFDQAREHHNRPTRRENAKDDHLAEMLHMALQWLAAFADRAERHIEELFDRLHARAPPRHMHKLVMKCIGRSDFEANWKRAWVIWDRVRIKREERQLGGPAGRGVKRKCRSDWCESEPTRMVRYAK